MRNEDEWVEIRFDDEAGAGPDYGSEDPADGGGEGSPADGVEEGEPAGEDGAHSRARRTQAPETDETGAGAISVDSDRPDVIPVEDEEPELEQPEFDWLTEVAIPVSIFGLLGAFLYYLIDLYQAFGGEFSSGLRWVCFWFLLATILITRIRTKYGSNAIAAPYTVGLGIAVGLFIMRLTLTSGALVGSLTSAGFLLSLLFNFALVIVIWWTADKVTRECTVEENVEYSLTTGFMADLTAEDREGDVEGGTAKHPVRIVLWVSLVAVLAFGLGTLRLGDRAAFATHAFWCMAIYVFFALLLLAMTNLSAIRMDVRRRGVQMTRGLVPTWIAASLLLVLLIVLAAAMFPRPERQAGTDFAFRPRAAWLRQPGRGLTDELPAAGISEERSRYSGEPGQNPETAARGGGARSSGGGEDNQEGAEQGGSGSEQQENEAAGAGGQGGAQGQTQQQSGGFGGQGGQGAGGQDGGSSDTTPTRTTAKFNFSWWWLLLLLLLLAALIYLIVRYRRQIAAFFRRMLGPLRTIWAAIVAFFERLRRMLGFGRRAAEDEFADLPEDPFADIWEQRHLGANMTPAQIVRHVYRAFLGLCSLRGHPRADHQTEMEFLRTVPARIGLEPQYQQRLTNLYIYATYSPEEVSPGLASRARDIWNRLRPAIDDALAARDATSRQGAV